MTPDRLLTTVPEALRTHAEEVGCAAVGFSARSEAPPPPAADAEVASETGGAEGGAFRWSMPDAIAWLASFADVLRHAHIVLTDGTVLHFGRQGFVSASPA